MHGHRALLLAALFLWGNVASGQVLEPQVKAAFLYRFLSFVEWPSEATDTAEAPLVIAVIGADDVQAELEKIVAGRTVNNRTVAVQRVPAGDRPAHAHVLFVGRSATAQLRRLAAVPALLLVAESDGALEQGALINFVVRDDRVRLEVAPDEAERRGLRIGARMLAVALRVRPGTTKP